ncbi:hypothetical protein [Streptomyces yaizuensis]|uniref:Adenylyl-sulfate kinase n=1 Tax=Streptomyces yaizuensis TaxID=2989713 RepID=A0ABQ5P9D0_9ACTN|nr:hypothetical protein [Streptomyces sp. YSPA8]GLF99095.1 adenylyl-sulfate kinase [Streptomyces sp. YSPA8]
MTGYEVLLIGGRSGVGKTTVGWEVSELLRAADVDHCVVDGDYLGHVSPPPATDPHRSAITERNLRAVWANFAALGQRRLIYTNTVSVLEADMVCRAMGGGPSPSAPAVPTRAVRVLLTATDTTAGARLGLRESGSGLAAHIERSARAARRLAREAPADTVTVATDGKSVLDVAREVVAATGWRTGT